MYVQMNMTIPLFLKKNLSIPSELLGSYVEEDEET